VEWAERAGTIAERTDELTEPAPQEARPTQGRDQEAGKSQELWIRDNRERMHFKLVEVLRKLDHDAVAGARIRKKRRLGEAPRWPAFVPKVVKNQLVDVGQS